MVIELRLSEGISQSDSQSVETYDFLKFHKNLMQRFRVDLKTFLKLAMPNQCCHVVTKLILGWFTLGQETPNHSDPFI